MRANRILTGVRTLMKLTFDSRTSYRMMTTEAAAALTIGCLIGQAWGLAALSAVLTVVGAVLARRKMSDVGWWGDQGRL